MNFNDGDAFAEHGAEGKTEVVSAYHDLLYKLKLSKRPALHHIKVEEELTSEPEVTLHQAEPQIVEEEIIANEETQEIVCDFDNLRICFDDILDEAREKFLIEQQRLTAVVRALEHENQLARKEIQLHLQKIAVLEARLESNNRQFQQLKVSFNELLQNKSDK